MESKSALRAASALNAVNRRSARRKAASASYSALVKLCVRGVRVNEVPLVFMS